MSESRPIGRNPNLQADASNFGRVCLPFYHKRGDPPCLKNNDLEMDRITTCKVYSRLRKQHASSEPVQATPVLRVLLLERPLPMRQRQQ